jgi:hypothetical protein
MKMFNRESSSLGRSVLLAALVLMPGIAEGQARFVGFTAGATLSDFSNYYATASNDSRWGATAGLLFGVRTYRSTTVAIEPAWIQRGGGDLKSDAIEVPLTFGAAVSSAGGMMRYGFYSGIGVAFKLSCSDDSGLSVDYCENMNGSDWFIPLGFRFVRKAGETGGVGLDVRYAIPLDSSFDLADILTRAWSFRLIYTKRLGS